MKNKVSFKVLYNKVLQGDHEAALEMIQIFKRKLYKTSYVNGQFNEDYFQELNIKLLQSIKKFKIDTTYDVFELEETA
ncbi:MAG: helix-turn-helix domain-containing protein [Bacillota bacterium]